MPVSVIILAAGASSRMGKSKQLLPWKDGTLISNAVEIAMGSRAGHVYVVLGSNAHEHLKAIEMFPVTVVHNEAWQRGMGSSIKAGLTAAKDSEAVLIMVCDQPFVTSEHLNNIIEHYNKTRQQVVASKYLDAIGVPVLFGKEIFNELFEIGDEEGAKKIIVKHDTSFILLADGQDLDTPDDYMKALSD
jgi:molybdenum cofactor cytidylyltransferase